MRSPSSTPWVLKRCNATRSSLAAFTRRNFSRIAPALVCFAVGAGQAQGNTYYWDTNGTSPDSGAATGTWGTSTFWTTDSTGSIAPTVTATTNADDLFFSAGAAGTDGTVTISGTQSAHSITFDDVAALTLSGGTAINLGSATTGSGIFVLTAAANVTNTVSTPITLNSAATAVSFSNSSTGTLQIDGNVTGSASAGTQALTLSNSNGTGSVTLSGVISNGSAGGIVSLKKSAGSGTVTISGANTYTGGTTVGLGTLNVQNNQSAATGGWSLTESGNTTVNFQANSTVVVASGKSILMSNTGSSGTFATLNSAGIVTNDGNLTIQNLTKLNIQTGSSWAQNGAMSIEPTSNTFRSASMTVSAGGTFTYAGTTSINFSPNANATNTGGAFLTIDGGTFVTGQAFSNRIGASGGKAELTLSNGGTIKLSAEVFTLTASAGSTFNFKLGTGGGVIDTNGYATTMFRAIDGSGSLTKSGLGTLTLDGTNTYTGDTTVSGGTLAVTGSISGSLQIAVQNSGTLQLGGFTTDHIGDAVPLTLGSTVAGSPAKLQLDNSFGQISETVGTLTLASNSILDLGTDFSGSVFHFDDSHLQTWTGKLSIYNWSSNTDHLFFGNSVAGLTSAQLSSITFYSDEGTKALGSAKFISGGELVPVPEPSALAMGMGMLGYLFSRRRRKNS